MKLLIVEDEPVLLEEVEHYLGQQGFLCESAPTYLLAEDKVSLYAYDVVVLDITLPDGNGLQLLRQLKNLHPETGVVIISAKNSLDDKLSGFGLGADDYLTKPFHMEELNARINALIRRRDFKGSAVLTFEELEVDTEAHEVSVAGEKLQLTKKEYELLLYFIINKNRLLSQRSIAEHLWGDDYDMADNYNFVYMHIKNLRRKLVSTAGTDYITTVYGMGYKWTAAS
ncbi:response regulator transcription factor [Pontibacter oryzae]|uniref:DNA-binding response regulator n=1 Tax=Pontibacter oryzae TaxID=2304593 RepID=A0A399SIU1_9BACT|nr:response regulator transcription factor [Pontibacter oryzae]RIJ42819.1 DNA-binding response regulator [Pontibacter oryzae]